MSFFESPADEGYKEVSAEIGFIIDLQLAVERALDERGLTQADLARLMSVSEARVSQMLSDSGANLRARTIGRIGDAIGMRPCLLFKPADAEVSCPVSMTAWVRGDAKHGKASEWGRASAANQNFWREESDQKVAATC